MSYQWRDDDQKPQPLTLGDILALTCYILFVGTVLYLLPWVFWLVRG